MGAAVAQDLHDLGPVLSRIEMGFDRLGPVVTSLNASAVAKILTRISPWQGASTAEFEGHHKRDEQL